MMWCNTWCFLFGWGLTPCSEHLTVLAMGDRCSTSIRLWCHIPCKHCPNRPKTHDTVCNVMWLSCDVMYCEVWWMMWCIMWYIASCDVMHHEVMHIRTWCIMRYDEWSDELCNVMHCAMSWCIIKHHTLILFDSWLHFNCTQLPVLGNPQIAFAFFLEYV